MSEMAFSESSPEQTPLILTVNGGSSTVKFAAFSQDVSLTRLFSGKVDRIGSESATLTATHTDTARPECQPIAAATFKESVQKLAAYLQGRIGSSRVTAIGHRLVRGGPELVDHQVITPKVVAELRRMQPLDPTHLPHELALIDGFRDAFPSVPQVACFDTVFHRDLPRVAQMLPIPRRYFEKGVRRFGFHGLSYTYLMSQLSEVAGAEAADGRVILAHLGSGASMAAVRCGKPIDTTMAFTPAAGLVMGTRPGDLDPGLMVYLMRQEMFTTDEMDAFISHKCGMLGVSETSGDMRDLLAARLADPRAADAVDLFCYQAKKQLCGLAATLGGLDTLVFAGGIGERTADVRSEICAGLEFLGLHLDSSANAAGSDVISTAASAVTVRIIKTDEELVMARIARSLLHLDSTRPMLSIA